MKPSTVHVPALDDKSVKAATGRTLKEWFTILEKAGGVAKTRRDLTWVIAEEKGIDDWWRTTIVVEYERAHRKPEKDGRPMGYGICATKTIAAPVADVYALWADGKSWAKWFGTKAKADIREGGTYSSADGDAGTFTRVRENKDLRFTWENPRHPHSGPVDVVFQAKSAGKTTILVNHNRIQTREQADQLREEWGAALTTVKDMLEKK